MAEFVHLHVHTEYSLLDGLCQVNDLAAAVARLGMTAIAMTDHGNLFGAVPFYYACQRAGVRPILGAEMQVEGTGVPGVGLHLTLLAESAAGYRSLVRLVSQPALSALPGANTVSIADLGQCREGIICLTGCSKGPLAYHLALGQAEAAQRWLGTLREIFGMGSLFIELQDQGLPAQPDLNRRLAQLAEAQRLPVVATGNVHYLEPSQSRLHDVLLAIGAGRALSDPTRPRYPTDQFHLQSPAAMAARFAERPDALRQTVVIAERCQCALPLGAAQLPEYPLPPGHSADSYLAWLCREALPARYPAPAAAVAERLAYELQVIAATGYAGYFLIVWDFVRFARDAGIPVGPGRGSGAGSLVAYLLGITAVDPLAYGLLFERFLNPSRVDLPDFDIDFCYERRDQVIQYVVQRYGADRVAQIITFGTLAARAAVRDVGRTLGLPPSQVDALARRLPPGLTLEQGLAEAPAARELVASDPRLQDVVGLARGLEGLPRHASTHAAGVVIAPGPLLEQVPIYRTADGVIVTQYDMDALKEIGLLKMDLLGLRTLTVIDRTVGFVRQRQPDFRLAGLPLDDGPTYAMLAQGQSVGVFQLEQPWVADVLRQIRPRQFSDIVAAISLCRPGPMQYIPDFVAAREQGVRWRHPDLAPILAETHGIMVYQEQVMRVAERIAGFSLAEADLLRRAVGKKRRVELESYRERFIAGALARGYDQPLAEQLYEDILRFAGYGFNRAHAVAYGLLAYQTAYLRRHWPAEFMAALTSSLSQQEGKVALYTAECRRLGVQLLPPDINSGAADFQPMFGPELPAAGAVQFGLVAIKNVGRAAVAELVAERQRHGPFRSLTDLCRRVDARYLNRKALESLIKSGACDGCGDRLALLGELEAALAGGVARQRREQTGQLQLFEDMAAPAPGTGSPPVGAAQATARVTSAAERAAMEKEALGFRLSAHPLAGYEADLARRGAIPIATLAGVGHGRTATVGGMITRLRRVRTRGGEAMAFAELEDASGAIEVVFFPRAFRDAAELLVADQAIAVQGRVEGTGDEVKLVAETAASLTAAAASKLYLRLPVADLADPLVDQVVQCLKEYPGETTVRVKLASGRWVEVRAPAGVILAAALLQRLRHLLCDENVVIK